MVSPSDLIQKEVEHKIALFHTPNQVLDEFEVGCYKITVLEIMGEYVAVLVERTRGRRQRFYFPPIVDDGVKFSIPKYLLNKFDFFREQPEVSSC